MKNSDMYKIKMKIIHFFQRFNNYQHCEKCGKFVLIEMPFAFILNKLLLLCVYYNIVHCTLSKHYRQRIDYSI